jgi:SAM-dependent methyltransferase
VNTRAIYERARTFADLHFYQKWRMVWPQLARLPREGVRLLDAGCGDGRWSAEIASRRPGWVIVGVDRSEAQLEKARERGDVLGLSNLSFEQADFADVAPAKPFDVVLSVCATHYESTLVDTEHLFRRMRAWLAPTGRLLLLVPRCVGEAPFVNRLVRPRWHDLFSRDALVQLCDTSDLTAELIAPCIGRIGTIAKQLDWTGGSAVAVLARGMAIVDTHVPPRSDRSLMWLLVARCRCRA